MLRTTDAESHLDKDQDKGVAPCAGTFSMIFIVGVRDDLTKMSSKKKVLEFQCHDHQLNCSLAKNNTEVLELTLLASQQPGRNVFINGRRGAQGDTTNQPHDLHTSSTARQSSISTSTDQEQCHLLLCHSALTALTSRRRNHAALSLAPYPARHL